MPAKARASFAAAPDEEIVARVLRGEGELFEILMRRYNQRLFRVARAIVRDSHEAEDVMQDAYVRAYAALGQFEGRAKFATWLTKIAVYEALARKRRRIKLAPLEDDMNERNDQPAQEDPERHVHSGELTRMLEDVVDKLPETYRTVLVLRDIEELSTAETAACLEISEDLVKVRLFRARAAMRERLEERLGNAARQAYVFEATRCDRIVERVFASLGKTG